MYVTRKENIYIFRDYTITDHFLNTVDTATYLGVELLLDLIWNLEVENVVDIANIALGFVRRTVTTSSLEVKEVVYKTLVCLQMEYAYGAYIMEVHASLLISKLETVQYHATHGITGE